jgi:hypothetical protein
LVFPGEEIFQTAPGRTGFIEMDKSVQTVQAVQRSKRFGAPRFRAFQPACKAVFLQPAIRKDTFSRLPD